MVGKTRVIVIYHEALLISHYLGGTFWVVHRIIQGNPADKMGNFIDGTLISDILNKFNSNSKSKSIYF